MDFNVLIFAGVEGHVRTQETEVLIFGKLIWARSTR